MMKIISVAAIMLLFLWGGADAGQAVVFVKPGIQKIFWPPCVETARQIPGSDMHRIRYGPESGCLEEIGQMDAVVYVEKSRPMVVPDALGAMDSIGTRCSSLADALLLADLGQGKGVVVAVIDTGIASGVFGGSVLVNGAEIPGDGIDNDMNGYVDDVYGWNFGNMTPDVDDVQGHGTQVASVLLAIAPEAQIVPVKVTTAMDTGFSTGDAAEAIYYAAARKVVIMNLSFSTSSYSYAIATAVFNAVNAGILVVAAAGNDGNVVQFPANMAEVVAVGSHDGDGVPSWFSPLGLDLDLLGPGQDACAVDLNGNNVTVSGTSFSTPAVTGAAAVLLSMNPHLTPESVKKLLFAGTKDILETGFDPASGYGLLDTATLAAAATPGVVVPAQVKKGSLLDVDIMLPPTDAAVDVYFALVSGNDTWWMDADRIWSNAKTSPFAPFASMMLTNFTTLGLYGANMVLGAVDTSFHPPGKYLWGTAIFDKNGQMLAPIGWTQMQLY